MKRRFLAAALAAFLLAGCSGTGIPDITETSDTSDTASAPVEIATTTPPRVSAVEDQPENTTADTEETTPVGGDNPEAFPLPTPIGSVDDPEMLAKFRSVIQSAVTAESVLSGEYTLIPLGDGIGDDYYLISSMPQTLTV